MCSSAFATFASLKTLKKTHSHSVLFCKKNPLGEKPPLPSFPPFAQAEHQRSPGFPLLLGQGDASRRVEGKVFRVAAGGSWRFPFGLLGSSGFLLGVNYSEEKKDEFTFLHFMGSFRKKGEHFHSLRGYFFGKRWVFGWFEKEKGWGRVSFLRLFLVGLALEKGGCFEVVFWACEKYYTKLLAKCTTSASNFEYALKSKQEIDKSRRMSLFLPT